MRSLTRQSIATQSSSVKSAVSALLVSSVRWSSSDEGRPLTFGEEDGEAYHTHASESAAESSMLPSADDELTGPRPSLLKLVDVSNTRWGGGGDHLTPSPSSMVRSPEEKQMYNAQRKRDLFKRTASTADGYVMRDDVKPTSIADLHHQTSVGARLRQERSVVDDKYGSDVVDARKRHESSAMMAISESTSIDDVVNQIALKSTKPTPAMVEEAASTVMRLSIQNRSAAAAPIVIMKALSVESNADANSRWAVTADEVQQYQRFLAVKKSLVRNTGTGEDDLAVRRLLNAAIKKNIAPSATALADLALADISFATGLQLLRAYGRLMGGGIPPPAEMLTRVLGLVTPNRFAEALQLYNSIGSDPTLSYVMADLRPAAHGHALRATHAWMVKVAGGAGETVPPASLAAIATQVRRIIANINVDKLSGDEGVYVIGTMIEMLGAIGDWGHAEVLTKQLTVARRANEEVLGDEDLVDEEGGPSSSGSKAAAAAARAKVAANRRLLLHTPTSLVITMTAALDAKSSTSFDALRRQFDLSGFKFADTEHYALLSFMNSVMRAKFDGLTFAWVEEKLVGGLVRVIAEEDAGASAEGGKGSDESASSSSSTSAELLLKDAKAAASLFDDSKRHVIALTSRTTLETLMRLLGALATNHSALFVSTMNEPSPMLWRTCIDVYRAIHSQPITPFRSGIVTRTTAYSTSLQTLLQCLKAFKAPVYAVEALAHSVASTNGVGSVEFSLFCAAVLKVNSFGAATGSTAATDATTIRFIRSHHHCLRLIAHTAAKAPQSMLQMAQCRRGVGVYLRAAVSKGIIRWDEALDMLLAHPLVAPQDPMPDPAFFLDLAVIASYSYIIPTQQQQQQEQSTENATTAGLSIPTKDLVLFALAMVPKALLDAFMGAGGRSIDTASSPSSKKQKASSSSARDDDETDAYEDVSSLMSAGTINDHVLSFIAAATHCPREDAWAVFDNQRHRLRGQALEFFASQWDWKPTKHVKDAFKGEAEDYFGGYTMLTASSPAAVANAFAVAAACNHSTNATNSNVASVWKVLRRASNYWGSAYTITGMGSGKHYHHAAGLGGGSGNNTTSTTPTEMLFAYLLARRADEEARLLAAATERRRKLAAARASGATASSSGGAVGIYDDGSSDDWTSDAFTAATASAATSVALYGAAAASTRFTAKDLLAENGLGDASDFVGDGGYDDYLAGDDGSGEVMDADTLTEEILRLKGEATADGDADAEGDAPKVASPTKHDPWADVIGMETD